MRKFYTIIRNVVVAAILLIVGIYLILYIAISLPFVQNTIKEIAQTELSKFLNTQISVEQLSIAPFNQVVLQNVTIKDQDRKELINIDKLGAGINLWALLSKGEIIVSYAEIIGLDAKITQKEQGAPLNLQFLIDALKPKDPNKPPTKFDLSIQSVVLRKSRVSFDKLWLPRHEDIEEFDANHIQIENLRCDVSLPKLANENFDIDIRRISFVEKSGFNLKSLKGRFRITNDYISAKDLYILLPESEIHPNDITLNINSLKQINQAIKSEGVTLELINSKLSPSDFVSFFGPLRNIDDTYFLKTNVWTNLENIDVRNLTLTSDSQNTSLQLVAEVNAINNADELTFNVSEIDLSTNELLHHLTTFANVSPAVQKQISNLTHLSVKGVAQGSLSDANIDLSVATNIGNIDVSADYSNRNKVSHHLLGNIVAENLEIGKILSVADFGSISLNSDVNLTLKHKNVEGSASLEIPHLVYKGYTYKNITADVEKIDKLISGVLNLDDDNISINAEGSLYMNKEESEVNLRVDMPTLDLNALNLWSKYPDYTISASVDANFVGNRLDNTTGYLQLSDMSFVNSNSDGIRYNNLTVETDNSIPQRIDITGDIISGHIEGQYDIAKLPKSLINILSKALPSVFDKASDMELTQGQNFVYNITLHEDNQLADFFKLPVRMVGDIAINGFYNDYDGRAELVIDVPYLQQGKDKLIQGSNLSFQIDSNNSNCNLGLCTVLPGKNGDITLKLNSSATNDIVDTDVSWSFDRAKAFRGKVSLSSALSKDEVTKKLGVDINIKPTIFEINDTVWHIAPSNITFKNQELKVDNVKVYRDQQFVTINGKASKDESDILTIDLKNMDLDYVFETLKINHVNFGGRATGKLYAKNLFSGAPYAYTDNLKVKRLTYNKALLGDAILKSKWLNDEKRVVIQADIRDGKKGHTTMDGGLWLGKDSLSFAFNAEYLNVKFLKPFMSAFTSDIEGRATGYAKLYGTFKDIDLIGKIYADSLRMKVDYTNTYYTCSDTVSIVPGRIELKDITLRDCEGHTALLNGWVSHRYFHEAHFDFKVSEVDNLLAYDTNEMINPDWYGKVYGSGSCRIHGQPGIVNIRVDMTTAPKSKFTFVLNDAAVAEDYRFLTFSDKAKEKREQERQAEIERTIPEALKRFQKKVQQQNEVRPSKFNLELFITATPQAEMIIVMDPIGGDKIRAFGKGNINLGYGSDNGLFMSGTYELEKGSYNFTLQDIIRKDFTIRPNSTISFNGDPFEPILDISAVYKVNTNLSDLDKSFTYDRDLNSTNIPVEAVLNVDGEMKSPNISFDINLPTVTQDVVRKVKSIISTDDMMNRQIIYLLALNRFYTPEYMGTEGHNNELASVASSTISSQLSNIFGQLSDNWSFSPYFRTDKGDFSDMEVDLALSSSLLNNRLLLNGNFGYRDRTTSSTTFVGDFDIEYLLNRPGTIRLKAYNHYNDQNYYLKSALTTQGIGVIFKYDFDYWFSFLRKKEKSDSVKSNKSVENDTILITK